MLICLELELKLSKLTLKTKLLRKPLISDNRGFETTKVNACKIPVLDQFNFAANLKTRFHLLGVDSK